MRVGTAVMFEWYTWDTDRRRLRQRTGRVTVVHPHDLDVTVKWDDNGEAMRLPIAFLREGLGCSKEHGGICDDPQCYHATAGVQ